MLRGAAVAGAEKLPPVSSVRAGTSGLRWYGLVVECRDPRRLADFWLAALGWREAYAADDEVGIEAPDDPAERVPALVFWRTSNPRRGKNRLHLDLRSAEQAADADALIALGARRIDVGQGRDATWIVLADPEGNELCLQREDQDGQAIPGPSG